MASANRKSSSSTAKRPGNSTGRPSSGGTSSRSRSKKAVKKDPLFSVLKGSAVGRALLILFCTVCVLGLDFLFSLNQFDRFFLLLGIELIIAVLIGWIRFVLRGRSEDDN